MKRVDLILSLLAFILALTLVSCGVLPAEPVVTQTATPQVLQPLPLTETPAQHETASGAEQRPVVEPTATPVEEVVIPETGDQTPQARVTASELNLRYGPGLNYRIIDRLAEDAQVSLLGRSVDGEWVVVRLSDGREGWVYAAYLATEANLAALEIAEARGGPETVLPQPTPELPGKYTLYMTIDNGQARVQTTHLPANVELVVRLGARGEDRWMTVATGKANDQGAADFWFAMPQVWPDGSPLTQSELVLVAASADGSLTRTASISYSP